MYIDSGASAYASIYSIYNAVYTVTAGQIPFMGKKVG
jgi:hypothetical protein